MKKIVLLGVLTLGSFFAFGQGFYFGAKGGLSVGFQNWSGLEQDPLFSYHGDVFIENKTEGNQFAVFAQLGYHVKGSALRNRSYINSVGTYNRPPAREFRFNNVVLGLGGKQKFNFGQKSKYFYSVGIRVEYTLNTNLGEYTQFILSNPAFAIYPIDSDQYIRKINYGLIAGGGLEFEFSEFYGMMLEFTVNPDFSNQYMQPAIPNVTNPYNGQSTTIRERKIRNLTFEVSLGFRFLRKVEYID